MRALYGDAVVKGLGDQVFYATLLALEEAAGAEVAPLNRT